MLYTTSSINDEIIYYMLYTTSSINGGIIYYMLYTTSSFLISFSVFEKGL